MSHRLMIALTAFAAAAAWAPPTHAITIPELMHLYGTLTDASGVPVTTADLDVEVTFFDGAGAGATELWSDLFVVDVTGGALELPLGENTALQPAVVLGGDLWVTLIVDGETLTPRLRLVSVPYAFGAAYADRCVLADSAAALDGYAPEQLATQDDVSALRDEVTALAELGVGGGVEPTCTSVCGADERCDGASHACVCAAPAACTAVGVTFCTTDGAIARCEDPDGDGCLSVVETSCGTSMACDAATVSCRCTDECASAGQSGCDDEKTAWRCTNLDDDACLERQITQCSGGLACREGACTCADMGPQPAGCAPLDVALKTSNCGADESQTQCELGGCYNGRCEDWRAWFLPVKAAEDGEATDFTAVRSGSEVKALVALRNDALWVWPMDDPGWRRTLLPFEGHALAGAWSASGKLNLLVVGAGGGAVYYDGDGWSTEDTGTTSDLNAVSGGGTTGFFAVGDGGEILYRDAATGTVGWKAVPNAGLAWRSEDFVDVFAEGTTAYAVSAATLLQVTFLGGTSFSPATLAGPDVTGDNTAVWRTSDGTLLVGGTDFYATKPTTGDWVPQTLSTGPVWGFQADAAGVYMSHTGGLMRFDGSWTSDPASELGAGALVASGTLEGFGDLIWALSASGLSRKAPTSTSWDSFPADAIRSVAVSDSHIAPRVIAALITPATALTTWRIAILRQGDRDWTGIAVPIGGAQIWISPDGGRLVLLAGGSAQEYQDGSWTPIGLPNANYDYYYYDERQDGSRYILSQSSHGRVSATDSAGASWDWDSQRLLQGTSYCQAPTGLAVNGQLVFAMCDGKLLKVNFASTYAQEYAWNNGSADGASALFRDPGGGFWVGGVGGSLVHITNHGTARYALPNIDMVNSVWNDPLRAPSPIVVQSDDELLILSGDGLRTRTLPNELGRIGSSIIGAEERLFVFHNRRDNSSWSSNLISVDLSSLEP